MSDDRCICGGPVEKHSDPASLERVEQKLDTLSGQITAVIDQVSELVEKASPVMEQLQPTIDGLMTNPLVKMLTKTKG